MEATAASSNAHGDREDQSSESGSNDGNSCDGSPESDSQTTSEVTSWLLFFSNPLEQPGNAFSLGEPGVINLKKSNRIKEKTRLHQIP